MNFKKFLNMLLGVAFFNMPCFADNEPEVVENEEGEPIGIRLHLPEGLIKDCKDKYWEIKGENASKIQSDIEKLMQTQEGCNEWCKQNIAGTEYKESNRKIFAKALLLINEKDYVIPRDFCKKVDLAGILTRLHMKALVNCMCCKRTTEERYLRILCWLIQDFVY